MTVRASQTAGVWLQTPLIHMGHLYLRVWLPCENQLPTSGTIKYSTEVNTSSRHSSIKSQKQEQSSEVPQWWFASFQSVLESCHFFYAVRGSVVMIFRDIHIPALPMKDKKAKLSSWWTISSPNKKTKSI